MTGPGHYEEAERLLEQAAIDARDPMCKYREDANLIAAAQVHATLALAAAAAYPAITEDWIAQRGTTSGWLRVTS